MSDNNPSISSPTAPVIIRSQEKQQSEDEEVTSEEKNTTTTETIIVAGKEDEATTTAPSKPATSQSDTSAAAGTLPSIYNRFVASFENALHELIETNEEPNARKQKLQSLDLEGAAAYIKEHQPSIVFMVGAGISTSAGIPDFRTPGTGLYDNLASYNIPTPHSIFEIGCFKRNPEPFFVLAKELFHDNIRPTPAHYFIKLVDEKGLLRRCYTQNIDSLEFLTGLGEDKVVTAHGSHRSSTCLSCKRKYDYEWIMSKLRDPEVKVPRCEHCGKKGNIVKPDIVFFGESLPSRFFSNSLVDFPKCDLLIIMGTSLVVHPFASLVNNVPEDTPRLLINLVPVGLDSLSYMESSNIRDVFYQSKCDDAVFRFARLLGWEDELKGMLQKAAATQ